jgi:site-specific DNA-methyltransferase (adenine-specific)
MLTETTERALWFCPDGEGWAYNLDTAKSMNYSMNLRDVWTFYTERDDRLHPTQKPLDLMVRCVQLFTRRNDLIVDPFCGSGTTLAAAKLHGRRYLGCDLEAKYVEMAQKRLAKPFDTPLFAEVAS